MPGSDGLIFMEKESEKVIKILSTNYDESENVNKAVNNIVDKVSYLTSHNGHEEKAKLPAIRFSALPLEGLMKIAYKPVEEKVLGR